MKDRHGVFHIIEQENGRFRARRKYPGKAALFNDWSDIEQLIEIPIGDLTAGVTDDTFKIEFWKSKFLGTHTQVMTETFRLRDFLGYDVTFNWRDGLEGGYSDQYEDPTAPIDESLTVDGRKVTIVSAPGGTADHATIKFNTDVAWWAGVKTFDRTGKGWLIEKVEGKYNPATRTISQPIDSPPKEVKLEFWTAKALGVHTHMATKKVIRERFDGRVVTINWGASPATAINKTVKIEGKNATIISSNTGRPGFVTIKFQTGLAWWTGIKFFDRAGKAKLITKANGKYSPENSTLTVPISSLPGNTKFGSGPQRRSAFTPHMTSRSFATERLDGRTITINWPKKNGSPSTLRCLRLKTLPVRKECKIGHATLSFANYCKARNAGIL